MKKLFLLGALLIMAGTAQATLYSYSFSGLNAVVPDGSTVGMIATTTVGGIPYVDANNNYNIQNVDVRLNISGGYNGDLYGYLLLQSADGSTITSILLNRVGRNSAADYGFSIGGFDHITLSGNTSGGYADIHNVSSPGSGQTYLADGRAIDPNGNFAGASRTAGLETLNGHNANGTWTLFLADLSVGSQSTLVDWGLDITVVPEPTTWALGILAGLVMAVSLLHQRRRLT